MEKWITAGEAARILNVHPETLRRRSSSVEGLRLKRNHLNQREYWEADIYLLAQSLSAGHWRLPKNLGPGPQLPEPSAWDKRAKRLEQRYDNLSFATRKTLQVVGVIAATWVIFGIMALFSAFVFSVITSPFGVEHDTAYYLTQSPIKWLLWIAFAYSLLRIITLPVIVWQEHSRAVTKDNIYS